MATVAHLVSVLESRGVVFWASGEMLRFDTSDAQLRPGDPELVGLLVLEREREAVEFIKRRELTDQFGKFAGIFRLCTYRIYSPGGTLSWLRDKCPRLYRDLGRQADLVQELWEGGASVEEFSLAVRLLEEKHGAARSFFLACQREANEREEVFNVGREAGRV